jgi:hypothetical protein
MSIAHGPASPVPEPSTFPDATPEQINLYEALKAAGYDFDRDREGPGSRWWTWHLRTTRNSIDQPALAVLQAVVSRYSVAYLEWEKRHLPAHRQWNPSIAGDWLQLSTLDLGRYLDYSDETVLRAVNRLVSQGYLLSERRKGKLWVYPVADRIVAISQPIPLEARQRRMEPAREKAREARRRYRRRRRERERALKQQAAIR